MKKQVELTEFVLKKCEMGERLHDKLTKSYEYPNFGAPFREADKYFFFHNSGLQLQKVMYMHVYMVVELYSKVRLEMFHWLLTRKVEEKFNYAEEHLTMALIMDHQAVSKETRKILIERADNFNMALNDVSIASPTFGRECMAAIEAKQMVAHELEKIASFFPLITYNLFGFASDAADLFVAAIHGGWRWWSVGDVGAECLPIIVSHVKGVEVCASDNRGVGRSYIPTRRSEYMTAKASLADNRTANW
ncbi:prolyl endopeptidase-like protein [Tanacetum coccineum]|uniref:Prohibitin n=1 Tax=Tanacetum coccineum TaxID=301880 RepID=A0ABQ5G6H8_9ASTR